MQKKRIKKMRIKILHMPLYHGRDEFMEKQEETLKNQHSLKVDDYIFNKKDYKRKEQLK